MLRSRNSILLHVVKAIISATPGKIRAFPNLLPFLWVLHHHSSCDQIARVCTVWANSDMWSSYRSCNLQLKLPELVTLNFFLCYYILTKLKSHSLVPQTQPSQEDRAGPLPALNRCWGCSPAFVRGAEGLQSAAGRCSGWIREECQQEHLPLLLPA